MNLRIIRKKIKSINNVKKITKAMQLVSAVKMKKAQQEALEGIPYRSFLDRIFQKISSKVQKDISPLFFSHSKNKKNLYIVISSNKGLCGFFNVSIFKFIIKNINLENSDFLTLGKKGASFISKIGGNIIADFSKINFFNAPSPILKESITRFLSGDYEKIYIIYNHFINSLKFETVKLQLLPAKIEEKLIIDKNENNINYEKDKEFIIEPEPKKILNEILKNLIEEKIRGAVLESQASEHSARMIAMKNATESAGEIINNLTLLKNKVRQERITNELLDMTSAKISVEN